MKNCCSVQQKGERVIKHYPHLHAWFVFIDGVYAGAFNSEADAGQQLQRCLGKSDIAKIKQIYTRR